MSYTYNAANPRTPMIVPGQLPITYMYDRWTDNAVNQVTTRDQTTVSYDANGALMQPSGQGTTVTYTWNARHQLVGISGAGMTASFAYDGLGRRISKTVNSASTDFVYDGLNPMQELSGGSPVANLLTGLGIDEFVSRTEGGTTSTFLTNALGSTVALTDGTGTVQTEYTYDPFGMTTVSGASSTNTYQFTGRENDGTGLLYYRARYYSPVLQRFISEDPIGFASGDPNLYAYVFNSPTNYRDPSGLFVYAGWPPPGGGSRKGNDGGGDPGSGGGGGPGSGGGGMSGWDTIGFLPGGGIGSGLGKGLGTLNNALKGTYRTTPGNLAEKLALEEAKGGAGKRIMEGKIRDPRYLPESEWAKMEYTHSHPGGNETIIHYWKNLINGLSEGFKFK